MRLTLHAWSRQVTSRNDRNQGRFFVPAGDSSVSIVDVRDIAAVAAVALMESGHEGKTYDITSPAALTHAEMASVLSDVLGWHVTFVDIPEAPMREALLKFGPPAWQADGLIEDYAHYRRGEVLTFPMRSRRRWSLTPLIR